MLQHLKEMILKGQPVPPDNPQRRLHGAQNALAEAEQFLAQTRETTSEKLAERQVTTRQGELAAAELAVKVAELQELQAQVTQALAQKAALQARIRETFASLLPDVETLDALEISGAALSSQAFVLSMEIPGAEKKSLWRDPALSGVSTLIKTWLSRLEG